MAFLSHHRSANLRMLSIPAQVVMVVAPCCGESFERAAEEERAAATGTCAVCGSRLAIVALVPNHSLRGTLASMRSDAMQSDIAG